MFYVKGDFIFYEFIEGGIEILELQYLVGLEVKMDGWEMVVLDDMFVICDIFLGFDYIWQDGNWVYFLFVVELIVLIVDMVCVEGVCCFVLIGEFYLKEECEIWF